jgi:hypothetical protein
MTVEHFRNGALVNPVQPYVCAAAPIYGNGTGVGNELGHIVDIPTCTVRVFRQMFCARGCHWIPRMFACSLEANIRVINGNSSRESTALTDWHCKFRPNTEGVFDPPYFAQVGDQFRLSSYYSNRGLPGWGKWHGARFSIGFVSSTAPVSFAPSLRLKRCHACDPMACLVGWGNSYRFKCKFCPNAEGIRE